jgi:predicted DNA-binding transcriptional regulator AlpA
MEPQPYMTPPEVAELIQRPESTLAYWRHRHEGPPFAKVGKRVMYRRSDVLTWLENQFAAS